MSKVHNFQYATTRALDPTGPNLPGYMMNRNNSWIYVSNYLILYFYFCSALHCFYRIVLYCIVLYYIVLYCILLYRIVLFCFALPFQYLSVSFLTLRYINYCILSHALHIISYSDQGKVSKMDQDQTVPTIFEPPIKISRK